MDRTDGQFRTTAVCPRCKTPVVYARNGEMSYYTENFETFTRYGWDRVSYCPHARIDSGVMTTSEIHALADDPQAWRPAEPPCDCWVSREAPRAHIRASAHDVRCPVYREEDYAASYYASLRR